MRRYAVAYAPSHTHYLHPQHAHFEEVAKTLNVKVLDDWYRAKDTNVINKINSVVGNNFQTLFSAVQHVYPSHSWNKARFRRHSMPSGYWRVSTNQEQFLDAFARAKRIKVLDDFYTVSALEVSRSMHGTMLSGIFGGSLHKVLNAMYPQHDWKLTKFVSVPQNYWSVRDNQWHKLEEIGKSLNIKVLDDWLKFAQRDLVKRGASGLLGANGGSLYNTLRFVYPQHKWNFKAKDTKPWGYWKDRTEVTRFLKFAETKLHINSPEMWYRVSLDQMKKLGGSGLMYYFPNILNTIYPERNWQTANFFEMRKRAKQRFLAACIRSIYPNDEVIEEHPIGLHPQSSLAVTVDIFVETRNLAFEYQGEHHYHNVLPQSAPTLIFEMRDVSKLQLCSELGVKLIIVPYWWNEDECTIRKLIENQIIHIEDTTNSNETTSVMSPIQATNVLLNL